MARRNWDTDANPVGDWPAVLADPVLAKSVLAKSVLAKSDSGKAMALRSAAEPAARLCGAQAWRSTARSATAVPVASRLKPRGPAELVKARCERGAGRVLSAERRTVITWPAIAARRTDETRPSTARRWNAKAPAITADPAIADLERAAEYPAGGEGAPPAGPEKPAAPDGPAPPSGAGAEEGVATDAADTGAEATGACGVEEAPPPETDGATVGETAGAGLDKTGGAGAEEGAATDAADKGAEPTGACGVEDAPSPETDGATVRETGGAGVGAGVGATVGVRVGAGVGAGTTTTGRGATRRARDFGLIIGPAADTSSIRRTFATVETRFSTMPPGVQVCSLGTRRTARGSVRGGRSSSPASVLAWLRAGSI